MRRAPFLIPLFLLLIHCQYLWSQNTGIYQGTGNIPNANRAKTIGNFAIGDIIDSTAENGTYFFMSKPNKRIHLISQGYVRIGDPNLQSAYPAWLEVSSQSGTITHFASTDQLFQSDTFLYSMHKGGFQLPDNLFAPPFLIEGDRGLLYYNRLSKRPVFWDGMAHRPIAFADETMKEYQIVTENATIGAATVGIIYAQPTAAIEIYLPPLLGFDKRELVIKHIGTAATVSILAASGETINGSTTNLSLVPGKGVRLHATNLGWQVIGTF